MVCSMWTAYTLYTQCVWAWSFRVITGQPTNPISCYKSGVSIYARTRINLQLPVLLLLLLLLPIGRIWLMPYGYKWQIMNILLYTGSFIVALVYLCLLRSQALTLYANEFISHIWQIHINITKDYYTHLLGSAFPGHPATTKAIQQHTML